MTVRVSTRFKELILGPTAFETIFDRGRILIYSGPQPDSADDAVQGVLLAQITAGGIAWQPNGGAGGLQFERSGAWCAKRADQVWRMVVEETGAAGWFRLVGKDIDDGHGSFSSPRLDGVIGTGGAVDLTLESTALLAGASVPVQQFLYTIPPIGG